ncbi:MAG: TetR/AcrR family transcriptional regulator [Steroidobacter sp.]
MSAQGKHVHRVEERAPGRLEQRRERIFKEAESLFLEHGYAGVSINEIVRRAGGSLATLYSEFGSKEHLFAEIMRRRATVIFDSETAHCPQSRSVRSGLVALATQLLDRILRDDSLALYRISISEGPRFADVREVILEGSLPSFLARLGDILIELGVAGAADQIETAEEFITLVHGQLVFRAACGGGKSITTKQKTKHIERAVDAFLMLHPGPPS